MVSALLGGSVSSAIVLLAEELPVKQRARGQAAAALASAIGGVLGYLIIPGAVGVELFVAMAPGAVGSWNIAGGAGRDDAAGAIQMVERRFERKREAHSFLRYLSSDLSTPLDHLADLRRARHHRRHRGERLALLSSGFDPRSLAGRGKHAGGYRNGRRHDRISAGRVDVGTFRTRADGGLYGRRGMARRLRVLPRSARDGCSGHSCGWLSRIAGSNSPRV